VERCSPRTEIEYACEILLEAWPDDTMNLNRKIVLVLIAGISLYTAVGFA
jgi:hypothetical protein